MAICDICIERPDLRRTLKPSNLRPHSGHSALDHTTFGQMAWELGITREDNAEEWRELKAVTR